MTNPDSNPTIASIQQNIEQYVNPLGPKYCVWYFGAGAIGGTARFITESSGIIPGYKLPDPLFKEFSGPFIWLLFLYFLSNAILGSIIGSAASLLTIGPPTNRTLVRVCLISIVFGFGLPSAFSVVQSASREVKDAESRAQDAERTLEVVLNSYASLAENSTSNTEELTSVVPLESLEDKKIAANFYKNVLESSSPIKAYLSYINSEKVNYIEVPVTASINNLQGIIDNNKDNPDYSQLVDSISEFLSSYNKSISESQLESLFEESLFESVNPSK